MQAHFLGAGKGNEPRLRMRHQRIPEAAAAAGAEVHHAVRHAALFQNLHQLGGDRRRVAGGLQHNRISADDGSHGHAGRDRRRKIPGRNHRAHSERDVPEIIALAGVLNRRLRLCQPQRFARIELAEVDGLADIGIGLGPVLAHLENHPCGPFELALADGLGYPQQQLRALFDRSLPPALEGAQGGFHRQRNLFGAGLLEDADHLRRPRRIDRFELVDGLQPAPADNQVVLAAKLRPHALQRLAHLLSVFRTAEVDKRLIPERSRFDICAILRLGRGHIRAPNLGYESIRH